jgi:hypothetical protein
MTTYIYTRTYREYYKVEAETAEQAKSILEECSDSTDYLADELSGLEDVSQGFEYWGVPNE